VRRVRGAVIAALAVTAAMGTAAGLGMRPQPVRAAIALGVANGTVNAAAEHVAVGTGLFPNFKNGAIDSWVPLAHAHVDNSPFAEGTASPLDTGPAGQTAAGAASKPQPQYAEARYPRADATPDTVGSPGGPYAHAAAAQGSAAATATMAGGGGPAPPGGRSAGRDARLAALDAALTAWRGRFLTPAAALLYPPLHPDAGEPDGVAAATAASSVAIDPASGLVDDGDSRVATASFGGGSVLIRGLHVSVAITNAGTPRQTSSVDLGQVSVGGMPVIVGSGGVTLANGAMVPLDQLQQANEQLNAALAKGGLALRALAPVVTTSGNQVTVVASGIHVDVEQPPTAPGVPQQSVEHTLGEVFADSLAVPAAPAPDLLPRLPLPSTPGTSGAGAGGVEVPPSGGAGGGAVASTGLGGGTASTSSPAPASPGRGTGTRTAPSLVTTGVVREKPLWLLLLYFMWQALIIGTAVSLWWWRAAGRAGS
jgi:flagellin-like hook-associated protein FlgL